MERINLERPGYYSRIFLIPKKNGKLRLIIDLSKLNSFLRIQGFKMETVAKVRWAIQPNDWAFSLDLTDAYLHVPIHRASRKYLRFCLRVQVFQFWATTVRSGHKSVHFYSIDGCHNISLDENINNPVSIFRRLVSEEPGSSSSLEGQTSHSSIDFLSGTNNQSGEIRINSLSIFCFHRDAIPHTGQHCQNSSRENPRHSRVPDVVSESVNCYS